MTHYTILTIKQQILILKTRWHSGDVTVGIISPFLMIFAVFDSSPLTLWINCSFSINIYRPSRQRHIVVRTAGSRASVKLLELPGGLFLGVWYAEGIDFRRFCTLSLPFWSTFLAYNTLVLPLTCKMCMKERRTRNRTEAEITIDTDRVGMTGKR